MIEFFIVPGIAGLSVGLVWAHEKLSEARSHRTFERNTRDAKAHATLGVPHSKCGCGECANWRLKNPHQLSERAP